MKTKVWEWLEYQEAVKKGEVREADLSNGIKYHLAILCPDCGAKLWRGTVYKGKFSLGEENDVVCRNCHFTDKREMGLE